MIQITLLNEVWDRSFDANVDDEDYERVVNLHAWESCWVLDRFDQSESFRPGVPRRFNREMTGHLKVSLAREIMKLGVEHREDGWKFKVVHADGDWMNCQKSNLLVQPFPEEWIKRKEWFSDRVAERGGRIDKFKMDSGMTKVQQEHRIEVRDRRREVNLSRKMKAVMGKLGDVFSFREFREACIEESLNRRGKQSVFVRDELMQHAEELPVSVSSGSAAGGSVWMKRGVELGDGELDRKTAQLAVRSRAGRPTTDRVGMMKLVGDGSLLGDWCRRVAREFGVTRMCVYNAADEFVRYGYMNRVKGGSGKFSPVIIYLTADGRDKAGLPVLGGAEPAGVLTDADYLAAAKVAINASHERNNAVG